MNETKVPEVPVADIIDIKDMQIMDLALKNRLLENSHKLFIAFEKARALGGDGFTLDSTTLRFTAK